jgi:uncharacterized protein YndB with AHSA1/START domain
MAKSFEYTIYINASADQVWRALTEPEFTKQYWGNHHNKSRWEVGSKWSHQDADNSSIVDVTGKVREIRRPNHLVLTWKMLDHGEAASRASLVTIDIVEDGYTKLTLKHEKLGRDPELLAGVSEGWPAVFSSMKSLLETGAPLPPMFERVAGKWERKHFGNEVAAGVGGAAKEDDLDTAVDSVGG